MHRMRVRMKMTVSNKMMATHAGVVSRVLNSTSPLVQPRSGMRLKKELAHDARFKGKQANSQSVRMDYTS